MERIIYQQLSDYLEENNLLCFYQFGFRHGRSTLHAVTYLTHHIKKNTEKGNDMDLRKAFDTVHHGCLLQKFKCYGINGRELNWFTDCLFNRKQYVIYEGSISDPQQVTLGVPQGSILGPLLFILLVNDMPTVLSKC